MTNTATSSNAQPLFYRDPRLLNMEEHADLTIAPSPHGYAFAAQAQSVLISLGEFFDVTRSYPVVFSRTNEGQILPVALLGLETGENLFVDKRGNWLNGYVPAYVRRYPFITSKGTNETMAVYFDNAFDGLNQKDGIPLFEKGEPSPKLQEIMNFLKDYHNQMQQTSDFSALLADSGLLRQINAQARLKDGRCYDLTGVLVVDEAKLAERTDEQIIDLFRSGALAFIHAHLLSLRNMENLVELKAAKK